MRGMCFIAVRLEKRPESADIHIWNVGGFHLAFAGAYFFAAAVVFAAVFFSGVFFV